MRDSRGNFICTRKVFNDTYYYAPADLINGKYICYCRKHWEINPDKDSFIKDNGPHSRKAVKSDRLGDWVAKDKAYTKPCYDIIR